MGEMNCYYLHFTNEGCRKMGLISVRKSEKELEIELEFPHCPKLINHLFIINQQITIPKTLSGKQHLFHYKFKKTKIKNLFFRFLSHN